MAELPDFQRRQYAFAAHIRDPQNEPAPADIEDRRMAIYRSLFFNNLVSLLSKSFPVIRKIGGDTWFRQTVRQFMRTHRAQTPYFLQMPGEFVEFMQNGFEPAESDHDFLAELAHYEYAELALAISTAENDLSGVDPDADLLDNVPVKSELCRVFAYRYPVHRISTDFLPEAPGETPTWLAVYRRSDDTVGFLELNPVTARLLVLVEDNDDDRPGAALLRDIAAEIGYDDVDTLLEHGRSALEDMRDLDILTGARRPG